MLLVIILLYMAALIGLGIYDSKKAASFKEYAVAGKNQNTFKVFMTTMATIVGASATIAVVDNCYKIGFPSVWWLLFGSVGLFFQAFLISKKIREIDADTLPHVARVTMGRPAELLLSFIIVIAWIGVVAGQLVAMNGIISLVLNNNSKIIFIIVSIVVFIYTLLGGQLSVVKTDALQYIVILLGMIVTCIYLYTTKGQNNTEIFNNIELLNSSYKPENLLTQFFVIGGVYFLGPDIVSRNLISKDAKTAKKAALITAIALFFFALIVVFIGMWVKYNIPEETLGESKALIYLAVNGLPKGIGIIMILALLSAVLSSTDTCVINASTIFVKDILRKDSVELIRITVCVLGALAMLMALKTQDIIAILSGVYSVYTAGVIFPISVAILCYKKKEIRKPIWILAVILGGGLGIVASYMTTLVEKTGLTKDQFTLIAMAVSLILSLLSINFNGSFRCKFGKKSVK